MSALPQARRPIPPGQPAIVVDGLGIRFNRHRRRNLFVRELLSRGESTAPDEGRFWPLRRVSFTVAPGEAVGVVGVNGSGKSTLLKLIAGVLLPDEGSVAVNGGVAPLIEITGGFVNELTGRENIRIVSALHGLTKQQLAERFDRIVDFSGVGDFLDTPFRHYSSGMRVRLAFSVMAHLDEPILLVDEVLAVGDKAFRARCHDKIDELLAAGRTMFLVSHSDADLKRFCTRALLLEKGGLVLDAGVPEVLERYTRGA
ncbi:ATP-binding cassette domain-containing protein [Pseudokineococcus marinus]|uniref:ABC transporter ATP-binding protein n=1 Tax=Pseudokineococcus marinus TaxID=351215 RepID=UPI001BB2E94B|nr:ATP-binding cassette domain-containing protein [Pseudokineococcus marinus]